MYNCLSLSLKNHILMWNLYVVAPNVSLIIIIIIYTHYSHSYGCSHSRPSTSITSSHYPSVPIAAYAPIASLYHLQEYSVIVCAHEAIDSLFAHPPTSINDHLPSLEAYAAIRRRAPRRRFVREMVIGILLGPVTRFEWSPRHTGASGPRRGREEAKIDLNVRREVGIPRPLAASRVFPNPAKDCDSDSYISSRAQPPANNVATV